MFDYVFPENGLMAYRNGELIGATSFREHLGEERLKAFINFTLRYLSEVDIPVKRGTFIEFRSGMLNVSPIGRNCSQEERDEFERYDSHHGVRAAMVAALKARFGDFGLKYSIGRQISFELLPIVNIARAQTRPPTPRPHRPVAALATAGLGQDVLPALRRGRGL
jgi:phosphomannomutase